jgi:hypothetical protein
VPFDELRAHNRHRLPRKFPTNADFSTMRVAAAARISDRCGVPEHEADHSHQACLAGRMTV